MAALTASGVTVNVIYKDGRPNGRYYKVMSVTLVLSAQGGLTNNIPASLFGMSVLTRAFGFRDASSVQVGVGPSFDATNLVFYTPGSGNPADQTGTFKGYIGGIEN